MSDRRFTWNSHKANRNRLKHRVSFEEAQTVFFDEQALLLPDPDHSEEEERFVILGRSMLKRLLVVVHRYRANDHEIRVISARKATRQERQQHKEKWS